MYDQVDDQQVKPRRMGCHKGKHHPAKREKAQDACRIYPFLGDRAYLRGKQGADIAGVFILCPCKRFSDVLSPRMIFTECSYYIFVLPYFGACILIQQVVQVLLSYIGCCTIRFLEKLPCEDVNFTIQCRLYANKIVFINKPFIKYNYRINSSCRTISKSSFNIFKNLSSILQFLKDTGNENILRENFYQFCSESVTNNYYTTPDRLKKFYDKKCSRLLPVKFYKIYKNRVCGSTKFIQNIFSITNYLTPQKKYKYLNILGLHFLLYTK